MRSRSPTFGLTLAALVLALVAALGQAARYDAQADALEEQCRHLATPVLGVEVGEGGVAHGRQAVHGSQPARLSGDSA